MAANIGIVRITNTVASQVTADIAGGNTVANADDNHYSAATTSNNPVRIPATGTNYSYWVSTRLIAYTNPPGTINNIRWYTNGANNFGTGVTSLFHQATTYQQASGTVGTSGTQLTVTNYTSLLAAPVDPFGYNVTGSPSFPVTGDITFGSTTPAQFGNYVVYQLNVGTTAQPGATSATFTWLYDES
jgi:hypothetical protein